jgi:hypothetical protein
LAERKYRNLKQANSQQPAASIEMSWKKQEIPDISGQENIAIWQKIEAFVNRN